MTKDEHRLLTEAVVKADDLFKLTSGYPADCKIKVPSFEVLNELLDFLTINTKYLLFDLEATQREKALLEQNKGDKN